MTEETKNGSWLVSAIILFILVGGFFVFKKSKLLSREHDYYAYYANVQGLMASSEVQMNGARIGKISDIDLNEQGKVKVTLRIKKEVQLPKGTLALLASGGLFTDKVIKLIPGNDAVILPDKSVLPTAYDTSVMQVSVQITPYIESIKLLLESTDSSLLAFHELTRPGLFSNITGKLISAQDKFRDYSLTTEKWNHKSDSITTSLAKLDSATSRFAAKNQKTTNSIVSLQTKTEQLKNKQLNEGIKKLGNAAGSLYQGFSKLNNKDSSGFSSFVSSGHFYEKSSSTYDTLSRNLKKLRQTPPGFSVFGKSKKK